MAKVVILSGSAAELSLSDRIRHAAGKGLEAASRTYLDHTWLQASLDGLAVLALIYAADVWLGYPLAFRLAYVAPVYFACLRGHRKAELFVMGIVILVSAKVDSRALGKPAETEWLALAVRTGVFLGLTHAIHRVQNQLRSASYKATHDQLTGCYNRLAIESLLGDAVRSHYVSGESIVAAMIDCDKFKALNDTYGHQHGDRVLQTLVRQLQKSLPSNAAIGRNGGDEFVVVFRNRSLEQAAAHLAKAAERFVDATFALGTRTEITYGLAVCGEHGHDVPSMLRAADQNMYCRKTMKNMAIVEERQAVVA